VVSVTDPSGSILGFLDRSRSFSIKQLLSCTHEAEWTPFQTHYSFFFYYQSKLVFYDEGKFQMSQVVKGTFGPKGNVGFYSWIDVLNSSREMGNPFHSVTMRESLAPLVDTHMKTDFLALPFTRPLGALRKGQRAGFERDIYNS
jgi:hypothetical protein